MGVILPDKLYFKIGEVARIAEVRTSVLRFWETEFSFLKPVKSLTGQRLYTKQEVELILQVKHLLYNKKFTIEGVKNQFSPKGKTLVTHEVAVKEQSVSTELVLLLKEIRQELQSLRNCL